MSRVRDKADFQFAGEDYTHGGGVKYVANMIQTTDLTASGAITDIHLQDIQDVASVSASNDGYYLKYDHATTSFAWSQVSGGSSLTIQDEGSDLTTDATTLNFVGSGVTATGSGATKTITITGGGGGGSMNDLVDDTTPQLGGTLDSNSQNVVLKGTGPYHNNNITFDASQDILHFEDGMAIRMGTGSGSANGEDFWIFHNGTDSYIEHRPTAPGKLMVNSNYMELRASGGYKYMLGRDSTGYGVDEVKFYFGANSEKLALSATGIAVTGDVNLDSGSVRYTFNVSSSGASAYVFSDTAQVYFPANANNPTLYLKRGDIYKFALNVSGHPFYIKTVAGTGTGNQYTSGVTGNGNVVGELIFKVPMDAPDTLYYQCSAHGAMVGTINIMGAGGGGGSTGDISFSGSTLSSSGTTITLDDNVTVSGTLTSSQAGAPILTSASSITLRADTSSRVHVDQSPLRLYNVSTTNRNLITLADGDLVYDSTLNKPYISENGSWKNIITSSNDNAYVGSIIEESIAATSTSGTINFYVKAYHIMKFTVNQTANRTINITGDVATTLNNYLVNDQFVSIAVSFQNGSTPYYINLIQIDGTTVTPKWSGGTAPSGGSASSDDWYTFSIVKTGSAQFEVYGTFTKFA